MIWNNVKTVHHRWMMNYLKKRGWCVFYLEPEYRTCSVADRDGGCCWLALYQSGEKK